MKAYFDFGSHNCDGLRQMTTILGITSDWDIHLFEPNPYTDTQGFLMGYPFTVKLYKQAVWSENKKMTFYPQSMIDHRSKIIDTPQGQVRTVHLDGMGSSLEVTDSCEPGLGNIKVEVEAICIIDALKQTVCDEIYIKMDIEGAEYEVLERLISDPISLKVKVAYIEWHSRKNQDMAEIRDRLKSKCSFTIYDWH
jgi:FkbM family methyltransferase